MKSRNMLAEIKNALNTYPGLQEPDGSLHEFAKNLDIQSFEDFRKKYPDGKIPFYRLNLIDQNGNTPLHTALHNNDINNPKTQNFINYMVKELGAKPDIPDAHNRTLAHYSNPSDNNKKKSLQLSNLKSIIKEMDNIDSLRHIDSSNRHTGRSNRYNIATQPTTMPTTSVPSTLEDLLNKLPQTFENIPNKLGKILQDTSQKVSDTLSGPFTNRSKPVQGGKERYSERSQLNSRKQHYMDDAGIPMNEARITKRIVNQDQYHKLINEENELLRKEEMLRNKRLINRQFNTPTFESEVRAKNKRRTITNQRLNMFGGARDDEFDDDINNSSESDSDTSSSSSIDLTFGGVSDDDFDRDFDRDDNNKQDKDDNDDDDFFNGSDGLDNLGYDERDNMDRPRDKQATDLFNKYLLKIKELLGVDDEKAKEYRTIIKLHFESKYPDLKGRQSDLKKMQKMEPYFESKTKLKNLLESIDVKSIKKFMDERRQTNETAKENKQNKPTNKTDKTDKTDKTSEDRTKKTSREKNKSTQSRLKDGFSYIDSEMISLSSTDSLSDSDF